MLFFVFGLPGAFTGWCESVVRRLAERGGCPAGLLHADTLEDLALSAVRNGVSHGVVGSRQPGGRLRSSVVASPRHFLVVRDDPRQALAELVLAEGIELAAAVRQVASSCAALASLGDAPGAVDLLRGRDDARPEETAAAIAQRLGLPISGRELSRLVRNIGDPASERRPVDAAAWWQNLDPDQRELASGALEPFFEGTPDKAAVSVTWRRELFFLASQPAERVAGPIDITGRSRPLLQGPHIILPPGQWSLTVAAVFSHGAVEHEFFVEIAADRPLGGGVIRPTQEGAAGVAFDFALDELTERPLVLRVNSQRAAFDGAIDLIGARLVRGHAATPGEAGAAAQPALA